LYWALSARTAAKSPFPFVCVRPMIQTRLVGDLISFTPPGSLPEKFGPTIA
jgi:hypothetical protein